MMTETEKFRTERLVARRWQIEDLPLAIRAQAWKGKPIMTDNPVELDEHRGMAAQKLTEIRRRLLKFRPIKLPCDAAKRNLSATPSLLRRRLGPRLQQRRDI
ncbi:MAG TPA: hypothetical protein VE267_09645 [Bradyrhizobium sp.]|nr:hypothetical protein [Bradyrhizobium sp.]